MEKPKRSLVILYGICAAIWTLRAVLSVIGREYERSMIFFVLNMICSVIWVVLFIYVLRKYNAK
ncbi:MAG: hypothetical protein K5981_07080 [Clostridia bacterium]|nr:hypothetical protein [Clostridia bacterium]